jgi:hypothetical protein
MPQFFEALIQMEYQMPVIYASMLADVARSFDDFEREFRIYTCSVSAEARLQPTISHYRLRDAHAFWNEDLNRVEGAEPNLENGLDHFKQCGHLAYWLRRTAPIISFVDLTGCYSDGMPELDDDGKALRDLLYKYGMEYLSFDWAFQICRFHEMTRPDKKSRADDICLSEDYIVTTCNFLKRKNVSPHALFLILRSLFQ